MMVNAGSGGVGTDTHEIIINVVTTGGDGLIGEQPSVRHVHHPRDVLSMNVTADRFGSSSQGGLRDCIKIDGMRKS